MEGTLPRFRHSPLKAPEQDIRLLKLAPGLSPEDPIEYTLIHVAFEQTPAYVALSYCWGSHSDECRTTCNGQPFPTQPSLEGALRRLRRIARDTSADIGFVWVDAICIDQQNLQEKAAQISLMGRIYAEAQTTFVDLGDFDGTLELLSSTSIGGRADSGL
jgi:Heterokaryon incompatibility protein (HET)